MLLLLFQVDDRAFGLDASSIVQVAPVPELKAVPHAPPYVAGLLNYRGRTIPAIDLTQLIGGRPSRPVLSTRLVLAHYRPGGDDCIVGLIAERAVETVNCAESDFTAPGIQVPDAPYLGRTAILNGRIVQQTSVEEAVGEEARALLLAPPE
jgi:chemotaxis-related protein WspB